MDKHRRNNEYEEIEDSKRVRSKLKMSAAVEDQKKVSLAHANFYNNFEDDFRDDDINKTTK